MSTCPCPANTTPFPQPFENFSLTNWVELVKVDEIWNTKHNGFDFVRLAPDPQTIRQAVSGRNIFADTHDAYRAFVKAGAFTLTPVLYTDRLVRHAIYFFINKKIKKTRDELGKRCTDLWQTRAGADAQGSVYHPSHLNRFPYEMPSRGFVFR